MRLLLACALLAATAAAAARATDEVPASGWLVYGNDAQRTGWRDEPAARFLRPLWHTQVVGRITAQPLVVRDVPAAGDRTIVIATSAGWLYALDERGRHRWHARFGRAGTTCSQLDGFGITGTPAVDPSTRTVYAADAFGLLHARDLATGVERPGWPVRLFRNYRHELVWGASAVVDGAVFVPTGSICDRPMEGKLIRVDTATREMRAWVAVPFTLGGGGGIWGWGGVAYSAGRDSLLVVTGNAFRGGSNVGRNFHEWAGFGERLVELSRDLEVRSSNHPRDVRDPNDLDFTGSPVSATPTGCPELVVAANKNGRIYGWRADAIASGPAWTVRAPGRALPHLAQLAYAPATGSIVVSTYSHLTRYDLAGTCRPRLAWSRKIGVDVYNGSPTIAGGVVWLVRNGPPRLHGVDLRTGAARFDAPLGGDVYNAPAVVDGRLYVGAMNGRVDAFALR